MATTYKTPGVYVEEISKFPPSVAQVATAIPAFIGYTQDGESLKNEPVRISSLMEYETIFGKRIEKFDVKIDGSKGNYFIEEKLEAPDTFFKMYYSLRMYFANGGGSCYIISIGSDEKITNVKYDDFEKGLNKVALEDEPTLLVFPDAELLEEGKFYELYKAALKQCNELKDRFLICDVFNGSKDFSDPSKTDDVIDGETNGFRSLIGTNYLSYAAAYYPHLETTLHFGYDESKVKVSKDSLTDVFLRDDNEPEDKSIYHSNNALYYKIKDRLDALSVVLPPSSAMAGIYARVDADRGVWKAPANTSLNYVRKLTVKIDDATQDGLNIDTDGKSINALRKFTGKGNLVWGARTLDGNSNEWQYISVRRFFIMMEESTKKASEQFVFEPNDANTWVKVRAMIENFLLLQWRAGALAGAKPEHAFYVRIGLGQTMTAQDVLEGRMILEIGMAVVRPAEFIILRFSHKMQESR